MKLRRFSRLVVLSSVMTIVLVTSAFCAGQFEIIYLAGQKVMTLRDKGAFPTLAARAVAVDKAITEVISTQDTQKPLITVKLESGLWAIYSGKVKIVSVSAVEAKANNVDAKSLAATWAQNLKVAFPKSTPCSKLPASTFAPKPGMPAVVPVATKPAPVKPVPVKPVAPAVTTPKPVETPVATPPVATLTPGTLTAPLLLTRDVFNTIRALPEEEFIARRDELAGHLIQDLTPFITGKTPVALGPTPVAPVAPVTPVEPVVVPQPVPIVDTPQPVAPVVDDEPTTPPVKPVVTPAKPAGGLVAGPAATDLPNVKPGDPSYAKVPQKNRIRAKLEQARAPFLAMRTDNPDAAKSVDEMLSACRNAFAKGDFDTSEQYVDTALKLLGVE